MLFRKGKVREPEKLPPTTDALMQHTKRAHFQALVWSNACYTKPDVPPLTNCWDMVDGTLKPCLTCMTQEPVPDSCMQIVNCKCKKCCTGRCSCKKHDLHCTGACTCAELSNCGNRPEADEDSDDD